MSWIAYSVELCRCFHPTVSIQRANLAGSARLLHATSFAAKVRYAHHPHTPKLISRSHLLCPLLKKLFGGEIKCASVEVLLRNKWYILSNQLEESIHACFCAIGALRELCITSVSPSPPIAQRPFDVSGTKDMLIRRDTMFGSSWGNRICRLSRHRLWLYFSGSCDQDLSTPITDRRRQVEWRNQSHWRYQTWDWHTCTGASYRSRGSQNGWLFSCSWWRRQA